MLNEHASKSALDAQKNRLVFHREPVSILIYTPSFPTAPRPLL